MVQDLSGHGQKRSICSKLIETGLSIVGRNNSVHGVLHNPVQTVTNRFTLREIRLSLWSLLSMNIELCCARYFPKVKATFNFLYSLPPAPAFFVFYLSATSNLQTDLHLSLAIITACFQKQLWIAAFIWKLEHTKCIT